MLFLVFFSGVASLHRLQTSNAPGAHSSVAGDYVRGALPQLNGWRSVTHLKGQHSQAISNPAHQRHIATGVVMAVHSHDDRGVGHLGPMEDRDKVMVSLSYVYERPRAPVAKGEPHRALLAN